MKNEDYFIGLSEVLFEDAVGNRLMRDFFEEKNAVYCGIRAGMYYSSFARFAVYMENKYGITKIKSIKTVHVYELLEYMRSRGFKESTLKSYMTAIRQVYREQQHLFANEFELPTNASYEQYRLVDKVKI